MPDHLVTHNPAKVVVLRGDLYSDTGYGRATRALHSLLKGLSSRLLGVSLHEHKQRRNNRIVLPLVSDRQVTDDPTFEGALIINICLPDEFVRFNRAINVGYFFWETERLPLGTSWKASMALMDRLWAPSYWQSKFLRSATGRTDIPVVPWPLDDLRVLQRRSKSSPLDVVVHPPIIQAEIGSDVHRACLNTSREERFDSASPLRLPSVRESCQHLFLAVQTDAPRKGLPLLLANWLAFKRSPEGERAGLIVKLSSLDVSADLQTLHTYASDIVQQACLRPGICSPDIWFIYDRLSDTQMRSLFASVDAFVSASLGEGFGGPIAEALLEETPIIAPRHSSIRDLLAEDYPLAVSYTVHNLKLLKNLDVYAPSSPWNVVDDESFVACLKTFVGMSAQQRRELARSARNRLLLHAGTKAVCRILLAEMELIDRLWTDRVPLFGPQDRAPHRTWTVVS